MPFSPWSGYPWNLGSFRSLSRIPLEPGPPVSSPYCSGTMDWMDSRLSRREFLRLSGLATLGAAIKPPPPLDAAHPAGLGRVTTSWIGVYSEPSFKAKRLLKLTRDQLVTLLAPEIADEGPTHNPVWYRVADGYAHSGYLQLVRWEPQRPVLNLPPEGTVFEVSVPFTRSYRKPDSTSDPLYRLYYQSTAWVEACVVGVDGRQWYRLVDDLLKLRYHVRAEHMRWIEPSELAPISPEVPLASKRIEVSIARQELRAYEEDRLVLRTRISSGIPDDQPGENGVPTATPRGRFYIDKKMPLRHMGDGHVTADLEAYELPGVPWVSFFHFTGVAFHGTYWHTDFGRPKSHGCINMRTEEAKWLYRWTLPESLPAERLRIGRGTTVVVT